MPQNTNQNVTQTQSNSLSPGQGSSLSPRREAFCREYILEGNATRAALKAGYAPASARNQGHRLMTNDDIQARIMENRREIAGKYCADAGAFLTKLEAIHRRAFDRGDYHAALRAVEAQMRLAGVVPGLAAKNAKTQSLSLTGAAPISDSS